MENNLSALTSHFTFYSGTSGFIPGEFTPPSNEEYGRHTQMDNLTGTYGVTLGEEVLHDSKYFTPDIEDIRVGYECEIDAPAWKSKKFIVDENQFQYADFCINAGILKVPYLTKEQIETEGWIETESHSVFKKDKYSLGYAKPFDGCPLIWVRISEDYIYQGQCKDINTFRYICKLLNI